MDMNICDLKRGDRAIVLKVDLPAEQRGRLMTFRICAGGHILLHKVSPRKRTFVVGAGGTCVALGWEIAQGVSVWKI